MNAQKAYETLIRLTALRENVKVNIRIERKEKQCKDT